MKIARGMEIADTKGSVCLGRKVEIVSRVQGVNPGKVPDVKGDVGKPIACGKDRNLKDMGGERAEYDKQEFVSGDAVAPR